MAVGRVRYAAMTEGNISLAAAGTAKTIIGVTAASNKTIKVTGVRVSTSGKTATDDAILVEILKQSTSSPSAGTSTSVTPRHISGNPSITVDATAGKDYSAEPTTLVVADAFLVDPYKLTLGWDLPLGREIESNLGTGIFLRVTIPSGATVTSTAVRARIEFEE